MQEAAAPAEERESKSGQAGLRHPASDASEQEREGRRWSRPARSSSSSGTRARRQRGPGPRNHEGLTEADLAGHLSVGLARDLRPTPILSPKGQSLLKYREDSSVTCTVLGLGPPN